MSILTMHHMSDVPMLHHLASKNTEAHVEHTDTSEYLRGIKR